MTTRAICPAEQDDDVVRRWTAGTLEPDASAAFEGHLLECARCQHAVEDLVAVRAELARGRTRRRRSQRFARWIPLGAAAAIAIAWFMRASTDPLRQLARADQVPEFVGEVVRSAPDDTVATVADSGLAAYRAGDYLRASAFFAHVATTTSSPSLDFFLGASLLAADLPARAVPAFRRVLAASPNVYELEARLYLAKAFLRERQPDSALSVLRSMPGDSNGSVAAHARTLADSIVEVIRR